MSRKLKIFLADLIHDYLPGGNYVVPLNIGYMTAYLRSQFGSELDIRMFKQPSQLLAALNEHPAPDVVAFSNYSMEPGTEWFHGQANRRILSGNGDLRWWASHSNGRRRGT